MNNKPINPNDPAFPIVDQFNRLEPGATIRVHVAATLMAAMMQQPPSIEVGDYGYKRPMTPEEMAQQAAIGADCLIAELNKAGV